MHIRTFERRDEDPVVQLWDRCGLTRPWNNPRKDIARKLTEQPDLFLVGAIGEGIVASVMAGFDGHRGWVYYLAVEPRYRNRSYGRQLMQTIESRLRQRGCPKLNLQIRSSNAEVLAFYHRLGYREDDVVSLGRRLIEDGPEAAGPHETNKKTEQ